MSADRRASLFAHAVPERQTGQPGGRTAGVGRFFPYRFPVFIFSYE